MHGSARSFRSLATLAAALGLLALSSTAQAKVELPEWLQLDVEYRVQTQYLDPMDLSGTVVRDVHFTEQRLRVDTGLRLPGWGGIVTQLDILDGVLFGDNGDYGQSPAPSSGLAVTSRWPNSAGWEVGPIPDGNPLDPDDYGIVLTDLNPSTSTTSTAR